jgi:Tripartite tricarboxylate transporter TctB family
MSEVTSVNSRTMRPEPLRSPQSLAGGLVLIGLAGLALWLTQDLDQGTLNAMGPAMLPRWLAIAVGLCGVALVAAGLLAAGEAMPTSGLRGPVLVMIAILTFAVTIRPFSFAGITTPGLGLVFSGPLAILIGGFATNEVRLRDLVILALSLTPFCMLLFGDALGLAIPMFPQAFLEFFPANWSQKMILRTIAAVLVAAAALVFLLTRQRRGGPTDVADHSGRI